MLKSELRKIYLEKRNELSASELADLSGRIAELFFESIDLSSVTNLHTFVRIAKFSEIDTSMIYYKLWRDLVHVRTFAPRMDFDAGEIESVEFAEDTELIESAWGIREPAGDKTVDASELDLVIVPLLAFDKLGYRVGYGKGFYDKLLSKCRADCLKIGLSYFPPVDEIADVAEHDMRLDFCLTPEEIFTAEAQKRRDN